MEFQEPNSMISEIRNLWDFFGWFEWQIRDGRRMSELQDQ